MKEITIFQKNSEVIKIFDKDESDISKYIRELNPIMNSNHVSIIEVSNTSLLIKPSEISSIVVKEINQEKENIEIPNDPDFNIVFPEIESDTITDM